ncbi:uncharacterized protein LOC114327608 [Diabrotica virgifera virgifera]|uniref:Uncharacterized protein n=2 Tax=Diabrotica virgifera virgifera TaxID=50390 RepID=A0ABM5K9D4_DIAVI|nr:uncharacterized protein LOC114327608 [Diabrotica virgifera virgifera]
MEDTYNNYEYIKNSIQNVIADTWSLENFSEEICIARTRMQDVKNILVGFNMEMFAINNTTFFYDILIGEKARWTIKKEILKVLLDCLGQIQDVRCHILNKKLSNLSDCNKFYIYKLVDTLSIYGDYDFQSLVLELILKTCIKKDLKKILNDLFPESEELRTKFSEISPRKFDSTARSFLQVLNCRTNAIFSICCEKVMIDYIDCEQNIGESTGVWIDINLLDSIISWYTDKKSLNPEKGKSKENLHARNWDLIMVFRSSIENIDIQSYDECIIINIDLKSPVMSSQTIFDKALSVHLKLNPSEEARFLVNDVLSRWLRKPDKIGERKRKAPGDDRKVCNVGKPIWGYNKSTECSDHFNTSKSSSCNICKDATSISESEVVQIGTSLPKLTESLSNILKAQDINITHQLGNNKNPAVIYIKPDKDYAMFADIEDQIDNASICFTSEEQIQRIANGFDRYIQFTNKFFPNKDHSRLNGSPVSSSATLKFVSKRLKHRSTRNEPIRARDSNFNNKTDDENYIHQNLMESGSESANRTYKGFKSDIGSKNVLSNKTDTVNSERSFSDIFSLNESEISHSNNKLQGVYNGKKILEKPMSQRKRRLSESEKSTGSSVAVSEKPSTSDNFRNRMSIVKRTHHKRNSLTGSDLSEEPRLACKRATGILQKTSTKIIIHSDITVVRGNDEVISIGSSTSHLESNKHENYDWAAPKIKMFNPLRPQSPSSWDDYGSHVDEVEVKNEDELNAAETDLLQRPDILGKEVIWSCIGLVKENPVMLNSKQFKGFYLSIICFHYDILAVHPNITREINKIQDRYIEFLELNARVILCTKGKSMDIYERAKVLRKSRFSNVDIPLIVDDGGVLMRSVFKVCPNNCKCGIKNILLFEDNGVVFSKFHLLTGYEMDVDFLIKSIKIKQSIKNGTFDMMYL